MTESKRRRGGRRNPRGGAPVKGNVRLVCYVRPETRALIDAMAGDTLTLGQAVDKLATQKERP